MEREKLGEMFDLYADDVFRLAYSYLGNKSDAEDVCQSVFMKLADTRSTFAEGKEKAWLLTCTANACKNHLKSFWHKNVGELDDSIPFHSKEDKELHDAVMSLPAKYRAVIHLYYFEGYGQGEIADILHISLTAVQTRMSRAREILKKEYTSNE